MEKEYVRELDHTYLIPCDVQVNEDEYLLQMALRGKLPGTLPLSIAGKNGRKSLRADVTACTSIASRYKTVELTGSDLRKILSTIRDISRKMPGLLMTAQDLFLDPEWIFLGPGGDEVLLCYLPHISETEPDSIRILSEFILKRVDHSDQVAVRLAYDLFDQVSAPSYLLTDLLTRLLAGNSEDVLNAFGAGTGRIPDSGAGMGRIPDSGAGMGRIPDSGAEMGRIADSGAGIGRIADSGAGMGRIADSGAGMGRVGDPYALLRRKGDSSAAGSPPGNARAGGLHRDDAYADQSARAMHGGGDENYAAGSDFAEFSGSNVRKLPPPGKKKSRTRFLLPAMIILSAACAAIFFFQMDPTQILGMGFLCAALIWIIRSSLEKRSGEKKNIWFDDDPDAQSDDQFYQSLRNEVYAQQDTYTQDTSSVRQAAYAQDPSSARQAAYAQDPSSARQAACAQNPSFARQAAYAQDPSAARQAAYAQGDSFTADRVPEERTRLLHKARPVLVSLQKEQCPDIYLDQDHLILGKSRSLCDILLPGDTVSRKHARIERRTDGYYVTDLFSTNGTFLDGHRLESGQAVILNDGAQLTIASLHYRVSIPKEALP